MKHLLIAKLWRIASLAFVLGFAVPAHPAEGHPHVWVTIMTEVLFAPDGTATGVRHAWTFDDMYSAYAVQGLAGSKDGPNRDDLAPVAKENIESIQEAHYFTFATAGKREVEFGEARDFYFEYDRKNAVLTLHFVLPFKSPVRTKELHVDIYDPDYFIEFAFAEKNPVALVGAPSRACRLSVVRPEDITANKQLPEEFFRNLAESGNWGAHFANKITVRCL